MIAVFQIIFPNKRLKIGEKNFRSCHFFNKIFDLILQVNDNGDYKEVEEDELEVVTQETTKKTRYVSFGHLFS